MSEQEKRTQTEYEFILDGITTRMQMAMQSMNEASKNSMEKMAESNRHMHRCVKAVCVTMIIVVLIIMIGTIVNNSIWFGHVRELREKMTVSEVMADEEIPQLRPGKND